MRFHFVPTLTLSHGLFGLNDLSVKRNIEQQVLFSLKILRHFFFIWNTMINKGVMND